MPSTPRQPLPNGRGSDWTCEASIGAATVRERSLSVITAFHEPAGGLAVDAVERAIGERDVPLVALPGVGSPPVAGGAPGTGEIEDFAADAFGHDEAGLAGSDGDTGGAPRPEEAQGEAGGRRSPEGGGR